MNLEKIKELLVNLFDTSNITQRQKIFLTISLGWIIFIGYLTWWNGIKSIALDKSFKWDEWFWFGVVPAVAPYLFYNIWKKKD
jgi:hypothetical protein|tara:strand:- start:271 stop:519 length:249 start_codon:yes stop_codon:yes gene_type:complete